MTLPHNTCPPAHQTGLSLVELMISVAIGLVLLLGISTLVVQQSSSRSEMEKSSRQIENGRYATQLLHDDIQLAGFYGAYSPASGVAITTTDPCLTTGNLGWDAATPQVPVAIFGYAGAAADPTPTTCLNNYKANTAVLVIRRASTEPILAATAEAANAAAVAAGSPPTTYLQVSKCSTETTPFVLGTSGYILKNRGCPTTTTTPTCLPMDAITGLPNPNFVLGESCPRPYIVRIYYISTCSVCDSDTIPTLKMVEFVGGARTLVPLVEGIENMQLDYGIDTIGNRIVGADGICVADVGGDGAPDSYTAAPAATDWPNVMAVRVNLLARNNEATTAYKDTNTYNLGGVTVGPFDDQYKRHAYSQLVRAINPGGRREPCPIP